MLRRKTTFVLGAGASYDLKFPTGPDLQLEVKKRLQSDNQGRGFANETVWRAVQPYLQGGGTEWHTKLQSFKAAAGKISRGMSIAASIDNFMHTHSSDEELVILGKIAIALSIIEAEATSYVSGSDLYRPGGDFLAKQKFQESWYSQFLRMLTSGTLSDDPHGLCRNVSFIVFNYDRCLELILLEALQGYYGITIETAASVLKDVTIIHPYGSLGHCLRWVPTA